jgi:hypothetical protein
MNVTIRFCAFFLALSSSGTSYSQAIPELNQTIRVLFVADALIPDSLVENHREYMRDTWAGSDLSADVTVTFANGGMSETYVPDVLTHGVLAELGGDALFDRIFVRDFVNEPSVSGDPMSASLREIHAADIVIAITGSALTAPGVAGFVCGYGPQANWIGPGAKYNGSGPFNMDLDGRNEWFIGIVSDHPFPNCAGKVNLSTHEMGQLLGAGHYAGPGPWLFADSRADVRLSQAPFFWRHHCLEHSDDCARRHDLRTSRGRELCRTSPV